MDALTKLRNAYTELKSAKKSVANAHNHANDYSLVWPSTGFALENLERAMKLIEEAANLIPRQRKER